MVKHIRRWGWLAAFIPGIILAVIGCGTPQLDDLRNVNPSTPDYTAIYMAPDNFPNIVMQCIHGQGFATNTRQYGSVTLVPEWAAFCATQEKK